MKTQNLGYPRIGSHRELKKACEQYWSGAISQQDLFNSGRKIRLENLKIQQLAGIDLIPCNDFSYYDHVLDMSLTLGLIPERFKSLIDKKNFTPTDLYFAMARGYQADGENIAALEMTKWFDTNYHYLVPEFIKNQKFTLFSDKIINEFYEAKEILGVTPKPVLIGPLTFLLLGKEKEKGFHKLELLDSLLETYVHLLQNLQDYGATWIQFDEPFLALDLDNDTKIAYKHAYDFLTEKFKYLNFQLVTYFDGISANLSLVNSLPVQMLHVDLVRSPRQLNDILCSPFVESKKILSVGVIDGRNVWKNDYSKSLELIQKAFNVLGERRVVVAPSCSLIHSPCDLQLENQTTSLPTEVKNWMAFAKQKLNETVELSRIAFEKHSKETNQFFEKNQKAILSRKTSNLVNNTKVQEALISLKHQKFDRKSSFVKRQKIQKEY